MNNEKGFTIIKMITVLAILGILAILYCPKVLKDFSNERITKYVELAKNAIEQVKKEVEADNLKQLPSKNEALLVPLSQIDDFTVNSPYGRLDKNRSYVIVVNVGEYQYYFGGIDSSNRGIPLVMEKELNEDSITKGSNYLTSLKDYTELDDLVIGNTVYKLSPNTREDDNNLLLIPTSDDLIVSFEFKKEAYSIYNTLIKNLDKNSYTKEVSLSNGVLRYNGESINDTYSKDLNGLFKYTYFTSTEDKLYYASYVVNNNEYVGGVINKSDKYSSKEMIFSSIPKAVLFEETTKINKDDITSTAWLGMTIYPNNSNYKIEACGIVIVKTGNAFIDELTLDTSNAQIAKTVNGCGNGQIYMIKKNSPKNGDTWYGRSFITYFDLLGTRHTIYSDNTVKVAVKDN